MESQLRAALREAPVVRLSGPRMAGKTTTCVRVIEALGGTVVRLDDPTVRDAVDADPTGYLSGLAAPVLVDEYQQVPAVLDVIKADLSRHGADPGRWLLCGSVAIEAIEQAADSLGGRIRDLRMGTLTLDERFELPAPAFLSALLSDGIDWLRGWRPTVQRERDTILAEAVRGGFPHLVDQVAMSRRRGLADWVGASVLVDAKSLGTRKVDELSRLLRFYAASTGDLLPNDAEVAQEVGVERRTVATYRSLLSSLHVIYELPAYSPGNTRRQITRRSKLHLVDSGLAAQQAARDTLEALRRDAAYAGSLVETMLVGDLRAQAERLDEPVHLSHYRDKERHEVDLVVESHDGAVFGVEIKLASKLAGDTWRGLRRLRDIAGDRFAGGVVLCRVPAGRLTDDGLAAVPMDVVWDCTR